MAPFDHQTLVHHLGQGDLHCLGGEIVVLGHRVHHFSESEGSFAVPLEHSVIVSDDQLPAKLQLLFLIGDLPALRGVLLEKVADAAPNAVDDDRLFLLLDQMPDYWGKVAVASKEQESLWGTSVFRRPVQVIQQDEIRHILDPVAGIPKLSLHDVVGHSADPGDLVLENVLEEVSEEQHLGDVILLSNLFGPGQYIGLDSKLFPQGEEPVLVVHKSHGLILSFPSQQLQNPHILTPSTIELLSLYKKMRAKARTNKQRDDLILLVAPGSLLSGSFHQVFPPLCIAQTIQGNEGFFIWLQLAKGTWILSSLLRRPLGEPPIGCLFRVFQVSGKSLPRHAKDLGDPSQLLKIGQRFARFIITVGRPMNVQGVRHGLLGEATAQPQTTEDIAKLRSLAHSIASHPAESTHGIFLRFLPLLP